MKGDLLTRVITIYRGASMELLDDEMNGPGLTNFLPCVQYVPHPEFNNAKPVTQSWCGSARTELKM